MTRPSALLSASLALCCALSACPAEEEGGPDAAVVWVHDCGSKAAAETNPDCTLSLGTAATSYINTLSTVDWWVLDVPAPLPERALLTVTAKYSSPSTPVVLAVNVTKADGTTSIATGTDPRRASSTSAGGPGPAQAVGKLTEAGRYFVIVRHDTSADDPALDKKNPYSIVAKVESDPDLNEPNDEPAQATPIPLAACGSLATATGALSIAGDMDRFQFDTTACGGRTILYVSITAPASPDARLRLNYVLAGPAGTVSDGNSTTPMDDQRVATARLSAAGHYTLAINAYQGPSDTGVPPGDTSFVYEVKVGLFPDLDVNEGSAGNDTLATATNVGLSPGGSKVFEGRLSYTGDFDTYRIDVSGDARVYYKLEYTAGPGRFEAIPTLVPKQLTLSTADSSASCISNCGGIAEYTEAWCRIGECLHQLRTDDSQIADYGNYLGQELMPAGSGPYYLKLGYTGAEGGDDIPYKLTIAVKPALSATSEASPKVVSLPGEGTTVIGWGWGGYGSGVANALPELPRSLALDYDRTHDVEYLEFHFTPPSPAADQGLQLKWKIDPPAGQSAGRGYDVAMKLTFFDATSETEMPEGGSMGYTGGTTNPWYVGTTDAGLPGMQQAWDFDQATGTFQARSAMCTCLDAAHVASGKFRVAVEAINRTSYDDSTIHLQFALSGYPTQATNDANTAFTCPTPCGWVGSY